MNRERLVAFLRQHIVHIKLATTIAWLVGLTIIASHGFRKDLGGNPIISDHIAFYSAARLIDEGRGRLIYDHGYLGHLQASLTNHDGWFLCAFRNPPFYALLYVPTSRLPFLVSYWIWTAVSLAMLWFGLGWLGVRQRRSAFVLALSFYPVFELFSFGQNSLLSFGWFCLTYRLLARGNVFVSGLAAGMLLYKPQLLMGLVIWWVLSFRQYWKALAGLVVAGLFWLVVSFLFVPVESRLFIENIRAIAGYDQFMFWNLHNPTGFFTLLLGDDKQAGKLLALPFSIAAILCFMFFWKRHRENQPLLFAAAVFLTLWASPHTMIYEWSLAVIPAVLLWEHAADKRETWLQIFTISWIALFVSTPIARFLYEHTETIPPGGNGWAIQLSVPITGILAIWAIQALRRTADPR